jgi:hypothetical protein
MFVVRLVVIRVDDPGAGPLLQLLKRHIEVPERLQIRELQNHGGVQEPHLEGYCVQQTTQASVGTGALVCIRSKPAPSPIAAVVFRVVLK